MRILKSFLALALTLLMLVAMVPTGVFKAHAAETIMLEVPRIRQVSGDGCGG